MTTTVTSGVRLMGIASAVPATTRSVDDEAVIFGSEDASRISTNIGVRSRHVVTGNQCTSDLCHAAAERLLVQLNWSPDSIGALVFVSQTPDYLLPATSCSLHGRLGLSKSCAAFDLNLGCSGYVYGLWIASLLVNSGIQRVLLLVGDTISRIVCPSDRSTAPLFGDSGTATALEKCAEAAPMVFSLGTDGTGHQHLIVPAGGFRQPRTAETKIRAERENGNIRSDEDLYMDGPEIFTFSLREVPALVHSTLEAAGWLPENVDAFVFHQANQFMLQYLTKRMRLPSEKVVLNLERFGNTSSASIPLAMSDALADSLRSAPRQLLLAGFGVGLSWGAVSLTCGPIQIPGLVIVPSTGEAMSAEESAA